MYVYLAGPIILASGATWLPAGITIKVDGFAVLLSGVTALIMSACVVYSSGYFQLYRVRQKQTFTRERFFWPVLAILWAGLLFLWMSADLLTTYLALEILGLSAAAMMVMPDRIDAVIAGLRYLFFMLLGSLTYLLGAGICYAVFTGTSTSRAWPGRLRRPPGI